MERQYNHDSFDPNQLEFLEVNPKKHYGAPIKNENPLRNSPPSFFRTICLQYDILKTADKAKLMKVIEFPQIAQLLEIFGTAAKCLSLRTLVNRVLLAQSKQVLTTLILRRTVRLLHHGQLDRVPGVDGQLE